MPHSKKHPKNTNFNMRIEPQLKAEFAAAIGNEAISAGEALRDFMRRYIAQRRNGDEGMDEPKAR